MKAIVRQQRICVLATVFGSKPYCSLMAYVTDDHSENIYMVSLKNTQKYDNLLKNPSVSIMIDTRDKQPRTQTQALTVEGSFCKIANENKIKEIRLKLIEAHPHLQEFMDHPDAEILCIKVHSFLLLNDLTDAHFVEL